jgi:hypothetical protein
MNQSFLMHFANESSRYIPYEEIMFLAAIKANQLNEFCGEVFIIQVTITNNKRKKQPGKLKTIVKVQANNGEYTGYSLGLQWEETLTKGFDSIIRQLRAQVDLPTPAQSTANKKKTAIEPFFSEN